jgi:hypothetical protein
MVALALIYHDPAGGLVDQLGRTLPVLARLFAGLAVWASAEAPAEALKRFRAAGALVSQAPPEAGGRGRIGRARRGAVELALQTGAPWILYLDGEQALHWAGRRPDELARLVARLPEHDLTVLGRTKGAFQSHPRCLREPEAIVNHVFGLVAGLAWDVTKGARGLSRRAAQAIVLGCPEDDLSTDVTWPLFLLRQGSFSLGYLQADGLDFEPPDRHAAEVRQAGGLDPWLALYDADPRHWAARLRLAASFVEAMLGA